MTASGGRRLRKSWRWEGFTGILCMNGGWGRNFQFSVFGMGKKLTQREELEAQRAQRREDHASEDAGAGVGRFKVRAMYFGNPRGGPAGPSGAQAARVKP